MRNRSLLASLAVAALTCLSVGSADAKVTTDSGYTRAQTLNCALRFIRVDQGFDIVEKDLDSGYFIFNYEAEAGAATGSVQVLEANGRVRIVLQIPKYPEYHEQVLTKGLREKLLEEYGEPPAREAPKPKAAPPPPKAPTEAAPKKPSAKASS